jgi:hypothetical protein
VALADPLRSRGQRPYVIDREGGMGCAGDWEGTAGDVQLPAVIPSLPHLVAPAFPLLALARLGRCRPNLPIPHLHQQCNVGTQLGDSVMRSLAGCCYHPRG